jgi:exodeoxyribonuclease VII large subunit
VSEGGRGRAARQPGTPSLFERDPQPAGGSVPVKAARARDSADPGALPGTAISVTTLAAITRDIIEGSFPALWVRGEVVDFKPHRRGHWYFALRDEESLVRCVVWASDQRRMLVAPDDGMAVLARGMLTVYPARSELQLRVVRLEGVGDGLWRKAFEQTRARLERDGLFAAERKRPLPMLPRRVAVITSLDGAALHDVVAVAKRRCPIAEIVVVPAIVQGDDAVGSLCAALDRIARWNEADVVIIGRGGGSREELWAFNDERVVRAVAACAVPTIAAIGHEVDVTLCDLVADCRAATPSAAGERAVPVLDALRERVGRLGESLGTAGQAAVRGAARRLASASRGFTHTAVRLVDDRRARLDAVAGRLTALSPLRTMARGFAVVTDARGGTVSSVSGVSPGDALRVRLQDGVIGVRAERIERDAPAAPAGGGDR